MVTTKWTYHKEWSFASNYLFFFCKICSSFETSWKELLWCTNDQNVNIRIFRKRWSLILGCFFPVSILKKSLLKFINKKKLFQISHKHSEYYQICLPLKMKRKYFYYSSLHPICHCFLVVYSMFQQQVLFISHSF